MIDLRENQTKSSFIKRALAKIGVPDVKSAIAQLASSIRDHRHLESVLSGLSGDERHMVYESVIPHLQFKPLPLDVYVSRAGQRAEREQLPTVGADGQLKSFRPAEDAASFLAAKIAEKTLTLTCFKCTRVGKFHRVGDETRVAVIIRARQAGWVHDRTTDPPREICPTCPTSLRFDA